METTIEGPDDRRDYPAPAVGPARSPFRLDLSKLDWRTILPYLAAAGVLLALVWPTLAWWGYEYSKPESYYAHAPAIPFIVLLMLWYHRESLAATPKRAAPEALIVLLPAVALHVIARGIKTEALESMSFLAIIWSSVWLALGPKFLRKAAGPLAFLILMAPLPGPLLNDSTLRIQMLSTVFANKLLHLVGFNTNLTGNVITMDNFSLSVDVPCSGFKLLLSYLTFSAAFAYLVDGPRWKRWAVFVFSVPLSLVVNAVRIALIGVVGECVSSPAAHVFHDWSGMLTLVLGFIALFSVAKVLGCRKFAGWDIF